MTLISRIFVPALLVLTSALQLSCSGKPVLDDRIVLPQGDSLETIVIFGLNDFHGALAPLSLKSKEKDGVKPVEYEKGGAALLASHVRVLREELGSRLLILDAGDHYQGSLESNLEEGAPVTRFYNELGVTAAAIGNHEFDFGPVGPDDRGSDKRGALKQRMSEAKFPYLAANITETATGKAPDFPNTQPSLIVKAGGLQVGLIGLSTKETKTTTRPEFVRDLEFGSLQAATLREAKKLRSEGAQIIVVVAHVGLRCGNGNTGEPRRQVRRPSDPSSHCRERDELVTFLNGIPKGTVDAVVSGHSHQLIHHWVGEVPVIQSGQRGQYFNLLYLTYDREAGKVVQDATRIDGPVPICTQVFENQGNCEGSEPAPEKGRGELVTPIFHKRSIKPDRIVTELLEPTFSRTEQAKKRVVGHAANTIEHHRTQESPMGNLVTDAILARTGADVAIMNPGGIRSGLESGPITYGDVFRVLPFDNAISVVRISGRELKRILQIAESGARGFFAVAGVKLRLIDLAFEAPARDLNGDKKLEHWEIDRLIEAKLANGKPILDEASYKLATIDFLIQGGDDMGWAFSRIPPDRIELNAAGMIRDGVVEYLESRQGPINSDSTPLFVPTDRRISLEKPQPSRSRSKARKRRR